MSKFATHSAPDVGAIARARGLDSKSSFVATNDFPEPAPSDMTLALGLGRLQASTRIRLANGVSTRSARNMAEVFNQAVRGLESAAVV